MKKQLIIIFLFALCSGLCAENFNAVVIKVIDADTLICYKVRRVYEIYIKGSSKKNVKTEKRYSTNYVTNHKEIKIDLYGIDSPELDQPHGKEARTFMSNAIWGKNVTIQVCSKNRDRLVAKVMLSNPWLCQKQWFNHELIKFGFAWVDLKYCKKQICKKWKKLQAEAKKKKIGLWKDQNPIPPWEWRKMKKK